MIYKFRNQAALAWFFVGMICVALPVGYLLEKRGVELDNYQLFALATTAGALGGLIVSLIQQAYAYREFLRLNKYWEERNSQDLRNASEKYPVKDIEKGTPVFEEIFNKNLEYGNELRELSKKEMMKKFNLSDNDWSIFMLLSLERFNGKKFQRTYINPE